MPSSPQSDILLQDIRATIAPHNHSSSSSLEADLQMSSPVEADMPDAPSSSEEDGVLVDPDADSSGDDDSFDMSSSASSASDHATTEDAATTQPRVALSPSAIPFPSPASTSTSGVPTYDPSELHPAPPIPYTPDAGHLLITSANPLALPSSPSGPFAREAALSATARAAAQTLLNHLLTTCPITAAGPAGGATAASGVQMRLPPPTTRTPREKRVPAEKELTRWEAFAAKKGIGGKKKRDAKVWDEARKEWAPRWGYRARGKEGQGDWLVEVDDKEKMAEGEGKGDVRQLRRAERKEKVKRNERAQRANERRGRKKG